MQMIGLARKQGSKCSPQEVKIPSAAGGQNMTSLQHVLGALMLMSLEFCRYDAVASFRVAICCLAEFILNNKLYNYMSMKSVSLLRQHSEIVL